MFGVDDLAAIDDLYRNILEIGPLPPEKLEAMAADALTHNCGFMVKKGRPGSLRVSHFVPANMLVTIDVDKLKEGGLHPNDWVVANHV